MIIVEKIDTFSGHRDCVYALTSGTAPEEFFSAGGDGMVVRWNLQKPDLGELFAQVNASVYAIQLDKVRNQLWVGQNFEGIHLIDVASKKAINSLKITASSIFDIQFYEDSALIAIGDGTIIVVNAETFSVRKHIKASDKSARCIAVNPHAKEFAVGYSDGFIRVFGIENFDMRYVISAHSNSVFTLQYSPDYKILLSGSRDAQLKSWSVWDNYELNNQVTAHLFAINHISFSPDGSRFVSCSMDKSIKIWDSAKMKLLKVIDKARLAGHGTSVNKLMWAHFNDLIVSCSDDRKISVWKITQ